jgi:hypothetical protein
LPVLLIAALFRPWKRPALGRQLEVGRRRGVLIALSNASYLIRLTRVCCRSSPSWWPCTRRA